MSVELPKVLAPASELIRRKEICGACPEKQPHPIAKADYCTRCGCFIAGKTRLKRSTCPLHKW